MNQVFSGEDFDAADHICEVRKRAVDLTDLTDLTPVEAEKLYNKVKEALEQQHSLLARPIAGVARCEHEWPDDRHGIDVNDSCIRCGMSFMLYIHTQCP